MYGALTNGGALDRAEGNHRIVSPATVAEVVESWKDTVPTRGEVRAGKSQVARREVAPDSSGPTEAARLHRAGRGVSFHFHFDFGFGFCKIHSTLPSERGSPEPPTLHSACDHSVTTA